MDSTEEKKIETITPKYVDKLIDFEPTESIKKAGIGKLQKEGAVALFNMLVRNGVAYLADEVGMGKTYIALAVMSLLRFQKPDARVLVITPRRNIQEKWSTDLYSFVEQNWRYADHRVKTPHGSPDWPVSMPERLSDWVNKLYTEEPHDTILRMSSFSLGIDQDNGDHEIKRFQSQIPQSLRVSMDKLLPEPTKAGFSKVVREYLEPYNYDLIIVDEAHNLKYGYVPGQPSSIRNRSLYDIFGKAALNEGVKPWLLLLSATPMENGEPMSLVRQFQVFGRDKDVLNNPIDVRGESYPITALASPEHKDISRELQKRLIVRRVGELKLRDQSRYTRNMYRREWRKGGVKHPESPMSSPKPADQLVHAVLQKNVFDMLESQASGKFRVGALESFEIYSGTDSSITEVDDERDSAAKLADQHIISKLCKSYREQFAREVPHPKLNAVTELLAEHITAREKALVFVRRVATTSDLATRAAEASDKQILTRLAEVVHQNDSDLVSQLEKVWASKKASRQFHVSDMEVDDDAVEATSEDGPEEADLKEAVPSFFAWFFRGKHRALTEFPNIYSGRRLREQLFVRNRFSLILEENYVDWVLKRPANLVEKLSTDSNKNASVVITEIIERIPNQLLDEDNFRRSFHSVQYAALNWMSDQPCYEHLIDQLKILLDELFDEVKYLPRDTREIDPEEVLSLLTTLGIYPHLARTEKHSNAWRIVARGVFERENEEADLDFRLALRRREQIRHMQIALIRHGAPMIDLYLAIIRHRRGELRTEREFAANPEAVAVELAQLFVKYAQSEDSWRSSGGWELLEVKENFDLLKKLNFPAIDSVNEAPRPLDAVFASGKKSATDTHLTLTVRQQLNRELSLQSPTTAAVGGQNDQRRHRITSQFRMPGMPWVIVATNVYEEGVDLHTYCKTVVHHGISHTASSVEQRTGRVDRIGGLLQRKTAEIETENDFLDEHKIQSLFPYPNDTFEKFQVRRVLANCNRFIRSLHDTGDLVESRDMSMDDKQDVPLQITERLQSPFDVEDSPWLIGRVEQPDERSKFNIGLYNSEIEELEIQLADNFSGNYHDPGGQGLDRHYQINKHTVRVSPRSHREGDHLLIHLSVNGKEECIDADPSGAGWKADALTRLLEMMSYAS